MNQQFVQFLEKILSFFPLLIRTENKEQIFSQFYNPDHISMKRKLPKKGFFFFISLLIAITCAEVTKYFRYREKSF